MSGATSTSTWCRRQGRTERRSGRTSTRGSVLLIDQGYLPTLERKRRAYRRLRRRCWRGRGARVGAAGPVGGRGELGRVGGGVAAGTPAGAGSGSSSASGSAAAAAAGS